MKQYSKYQIWVNGSILHGHTYATSKTQAINNARDELLNEYHVKTLPHGTNLFVCKISESYYDSMVQNNIDICRGTQLMSTD